jgi:hypothetical protein
MPDECQLNIAYKSSINIGSAQLLAGLSQDIIIR